MHASSRLMMMALIAGLLVASVDAADARKNEHKPEIPPAEVPTPTPEPLPPTPEVAPPAAPAVPDTEVLPTPPPASVPSVPEVTAIVTELAPAVVEEQRPIPVWGEAVGGVRPPLAEPTRPQEKPLPDASLGKAPILIAAPAALPAHLGECADFMFAGTSTSTPLSATVAVPSPIVGWRTPLAWAIPIFAIGATLLLRRRPASTSAPAAATAPVEAVIFHVASVDLPTLLRTGQAATARGAIDEAIACFDKALVLAPSLAIAHFCKGVCLAAHGRMAEAYGALQTAVAFEPEDPAYRIHLARAALSLGKTKEAMDALSRVIREMPEAGQAMLDDPQLAGLRDHPRFLVMCGAL